MKDNMNIALSHPNDISTIERIIQFINELIDSLKAEKKVEASHVHVSDRVTTLTKLNTCIRVRNDRKKLEKLIADFLKDFHKTPEQQQSDIEMRFFKAINKLEKIVPVAESDIRNNKTSLRLRFYKRELDQTLKTFRSSQQYMASILYPDNSKKILSDPAEYQKLVEFWGKLAD